MKKRIEFFIFALGITPPLLLFGNYFTHFRDAAESEMLIQCGIVVYLLTLGILSERISRVFVKEGLDSTLSRVEEKGWLTQFGLATILAPLGAIPVLLIHDGLNSKIPSIWDFCVGIALYVFFGLPISYLFTLFYGLPIYLLLRFSNAQRTWTLATLGFVFPYGITNISKGSMNEPHGGAVLLGLAGAVVAILLLWIADGNVGTRISKEVKFNKA